MRTYSMKNKLDWEVKFYKEFRDLIDFGRYDEVKSFIQQLLDNQEIKKIEKLDAGYCCICSGNSIYTIENKVNEIIKKLNQK